MSDYELDIQKRRKRGEIIMARRMIRTFKAYAVCFGNGYIRWIWGRFRTDIEMLFETLDKEMIDKAVLGHRYESY